MKKSAPLWVSVVVVLGASLLATGGVIALVRPGMLVSPHDEINSSAHIYAGYLFSRNVSLAVMLLAAWGTGARYMLSGLMALAAIVQFLDAGLDAVEGRVILLPVVVALGALFALAAARLSGRLFWKSPFSPLAIFWLRPQNLCDLVLQL